MEDAETQVVQTNSVACDGNGGPLGHPRVFLHIEDSGEVVCPYCSRRFVLAEDAAEAAGH